MSLQCPKYYVLSNKTATRITAAAELPIEPAHAQSRHVPRDGIPSRLAAQRCAASYGQHPNCYSRNSIVSTIRTTTALPVGFASVDLVGNSTTTLGQECSAQGRSAANPRQPASRATNRSPCPTSVNSCAFCAFSRLASVWTSDFGVRTYK